MEHLGQVALRWLPGAQHCMENRKMIPVYTKRHRSDQIVVDFERQIMGQSQELYRLITEDQSGVG